MTLPALFQNRLRLPLIAAPMFLASGPELVAACCTSGIVGTFPALNERTTEGFDRWLNEVEQAQAGHRERTGKDAAPYGVNLIVHKSNPRVRADLDVCVRHKVPLIITSLGASQDVIDTVHSYGGLVFHDVTTTRHAQKAAEAGVDGLILVAAGAGGHAGNWSPFALLAEVRRFFGKTIVLAGAMSSGRDVAAAQMMGADFAYMGTRFLATRESMAQSEYKSMLQTAGAADIVYTPNISGLPASFLRPSILAAGLDPTALRTIEHIDLSEVTDPHRPQLDSGGAKPWKDIWSAGQGVATIDDLPPAAELVDRMVAEYRDAVAGFQQASGQLLPS